MKKNVHRHRVTQPRDPLRKLIPLTKGMNAIVDTDKYDWLNQWNWTAAKVRDGYVAIRRENRKVIVMHQVLCRCENGEIPDHVNGNSLDNRFDNLRPSTNSQNGANRGPQKNNTSGYKGVTWDKNRERWFASIKVEQKRFNLGRFTSKVDAARAYDAAALLYFGVFAHLNFPL